MSSFVETGLDTDYEEKSTNVFSLCSPGYAIHLKDALFQFWLKLVFGSSEKYDKFIFAIFINYPYEKV